MKTLSDYYPDIPPTPDIGVGTILWNRHTGRVYTIIRVGTYGSMRVALLDLHSGTYVAESIVVGRPCRLTREDVVILMGRVLSNWEVLGHLLKRGDLAHNSVHTLHVGVPA